MVHIHPKTQPLFSTWCGERGTFFSGAERHHLRQASRPSPPPGLLAHLFLSLAISARPLGRPDDHLAPDSSLRVKLSNFVHSLSLPTRGSSPIFSVSRSSYVEIHPSRFLSLFGLNFVAHGSSPYTKLRNFVSTVFGVPRVSPQNFSVTGPHLVSLQPSQ